MNYLDEVDRRALVGFVAGKMREMGDTLNGVLVMQLKAPLSDGELIGVAREALALLEEGRV